MIRIRNRMDSRSTFVRKLLEQFGLYSAYVQLVYQLLFFSGQLTEVVKKQFLKGNSRVHLYLMPNQANVEPSDEFDKFFVYDLNV